MEWFVYNCGKAFWFSGTAINSTELNSTSEIKPCYRRATVEPARHGSSTTFETGLKWQQQSLKRYFLTVLIRVTAIAFFVSNSVCAIRITRKHYRDDWKRLQAIWTITMALIELGGYSPEIYVGECGPPLQTSTLFQTKICDFSYPISDLTQNSIPYFRPDPYPISFA